MTRRVIEYETFTTKELKKKLKLKGKISSIQATAVKDSKGKWVEGIRILYG